MMKSIRCSCIKIPKLIHGIIILIFLVFSNPIKMLADEVKEIEYTTSSLQALQEFKLGLLYFDAGDNLTSYDHFSKAIEYDPYFAIAYAHRAFCSGSREEFIHDTRKALSQIHKVNPFEEVFININETYISGNIEQRLELASRLTGLKPGSERSWISYGLILQETHHIDEAREIFEKARIRAPEWGGIYTILGQSYVNH